MKRKWRDGYGNWAETHEKIGVKQGHHFKYRNTECRIRNDGNALLVFDYEWCDWISPRYEVFQLGYLTEHNDQIEELPVKYWHVEWDEPSYIRKMEQEYVWKRLDKSLEAKEA